MKELLERIAAGLVSDPDAVHVDEERKGDRVLLRLRVADQDTGKVIGRGGQVARAIRTVMRAAAVQEGVLVRLDIEGRPDHPHSHESDDEGAQESAGPSDSEEPAEDAPPDDGADPDSGHGQ